MNIIEVTKFMDINQSKFKYDDYLSNHIANVSKAYEWMKDNDILIEDFNDTDKLDAENNIANHDKSKYSSEEYNGYRQWFDPADGEEVTDGKGDREVFKYSWLHHMHNNPHHWEYWILLNEDDPGSMDPLVMPKEYVLEMIADWLSFSISKDDPAEIINWYKSHKKGIILHPDTQALVENVLGKIADKVGVELNLSESLDDNSYNKSLNPKLFTNDKLNEDVLNKLNEIANEFISGLNEQGIPVSILDIWMVGSNASYNYTGKSDIDLHIIVDPEVSSNPDILNLLYQYYKSSFNKDYDINIHGIPVELYIEDFHANSISNGIYSITKNDWIKHPVVTDIPDVDISTELAEWESRYVNAMASDSKEERQQLLNDLYILRKSSLSTDGEYGVGNLIFKEFRNRNYLDELKSAIKKDISNELSLESLLESTNLTPIDPNYEIVKLPSFIKEWNNLGLDDNDYEELELKLKSIPPESSLGSGVYKFRYSPSKWNKGKSGATRVIYIDLISDTRVYLVTISKKNTKSNLSKSELDSIKSLSKYMRGNK